MFKFLLLLVGCAAVAAQTLEPILAPRASGMAGAVVATATDPASILLNPAGLAALDQMGSDLSFGTQTSKGVDRLLLAYANPMSDDGSRFGTGTYLTGQTKPADWKYVVPYVCAAWQPMSRLSVGAAVRMIREIPRADSLDSKWSNSVDLGVMTPGKYLSFGARVEHAFGGTDVVPKTLQWGAALRSDNRRLNIAYQWDGDLLYDVTYRYAASRLGLEYQIGKYGVARAGYVWSETHRITCGCAIGLLEGGTLLQAAWSMPTERKAPTEWSVGLSYRI